MLTRSNSLLRIGVAATAAAVLAAAGGGLSEAVPPPPPRRPAIAVPSTDDSAPPARVCGQSAHTASCEYLIQIGVSVELVTANPAEPVTLVALAELMAAACAQVEGCDPKTVWEGFDAYVSHYRLDDNAEPPQRAAATALCHAQTSGDDCVQINSASVGDTPNICRSGLGSDDLTLAAVSWTFAALTVTYLALPPP